MRSRVSAALAAGGRPGPRLAICGTVKLCHTSCYLPVGVAGPLAGYVYTAKSSGCSAFSRRFSTGAPGELGCAGMAAVVSRESYFEVGLEVLSELGYGGLKLAEVC